MDYEKAYKELVGKIEKAYLYAQTDSTKAVLEDIFPELKESEDERIRKALIEYFKSYKEIGTCGAETFNGIPTDNILAWLEKRGDKPQGKTALEAIHEEKMNNANKIMQKFKVGDFIVNDYCMGKVIELTNDAYLLDTGQGIPFSCEHNAHLWTIEDAKDGDILFQDLMEGKTFIFDGINSDMTILYSFIINNDGKDVLPYDIGKPNTGIGTIKENKNIIHPATKEQRGQLEKAMTDAGYKWDAEKKELRKIENSPILSNSSNTGKQWTEEDEKNWRGIMYVIEENKDTAPDYDIETYDGFISWLDNIKQRMEKKV